MKKIFLKVTCCIVSMLMLCSITACGKKDDIQNGQVYDPNKAQLYISNFNGGVGTEWLYKVISRFTETYKDHHFTEGTTGVQVTVETHKNNGTATASKMQSERNEIYFLPYCNYYDMMSNGLLYEITDIVTEKMTRFGEDKSIEEKMTNEMRNYFKTKNGKYYAIPHYQTMSVITYDMDLFDEKNLFMSEEGNFDKKSSDNRLSKGVDGKSGTYDDGLPATYEEFYRLCETMKKRGVDPMIWSGMYGFYTTELLAALKADFEGSETQAFYSFNNTFTKLIDGEIGTDGSFKYKTPINITEENGYELYNSAGIYYSLSFLENIMKNGYYATASLNEGTSHTGAQATFLLSRYNAASSPIGMLIEGTYWPHESSATFQQMASRYNNTSLNERRLAIMPYPKATKAQIGEKTTILSGGDTIACINSTIKEEKVELAKLFLQYCETQESLVEFVKATNMSRSYVFDMPERDYETLNTFARSYVDLVSDSNIYPNVSNSEFFYKNYSSFTMLTPFITKYGEYPVNALKNNQHTALELFNAIRNKYTQYTWQVLRGNN